MAAQTPKIVKHILLTQFKDEVPREQIDKHINAYTNLTALIPSMKSFHWGHGFGHGASGAEPRIYSCVRVYIRELSRLSGVPRFSCSCCICRSFQALSGTASRDRLLSPL
ncbi:hypothetical protein OIU78_005105, partial [Salix suchowensis]